jgi:hypothetical protein
MADPDAYAIASIVLYSRIWAELERLHDAVEAPALLSQILRLEIHLLMQACESWRWRSLMSASQRRALRQTLTDVLHRLGGSEQGIGAAAANLAQDRLLDAVLDQYTTLQALTASAQIDRIAVRTSRLPTQPSAHDNASNIVRLRWPNPRPHL